MSRSEACELSLEGQRPGACESGRSTLAARLDQLFRKAGGGVAAGELKAALYRLRVEEMTAGGSDECA